MTRISLVLVTVFALAAAPARAASIQLTPGGATVLPGEHISFDLIASGLGGAVVGDYDVDITFDPSKLTFDTLTLTGVLGSFAAGDALDFSGGLVSPGHVNVSVVSTLSAAQLALLQSDPLNLATFAFTVGTLTGGQSTLVGVSANALGNAAGQAIALTGVTGATLTGEGGAQAVPEPATAVLCLSGLSMWLRSRRRSYSSRQALVSGTARTISLR